MPILRGEAHIFCQSLEWGTQMLTAKIKKTSTPVKFSERSLIFSTQLNLIDPFFQQKNISLFLSHLVLDITVPKFALFFILNIFMFQHT